MSKNKLVVIHHSPPRHNNDIGAKIGISSGNSSFDHQISTLSTSIVHQNVNFTVSQIGMIFGNLPFEPLAIPVNINAQAGQSSQEQKLKSKVVVKEEHCEIGYDQDHFYCGTTSLKTSTSVLEGGSMIQIKQEYDCQETLTEAAGTLSIWDPNKVQKRKRSKLPQYTLSPLARFLNQLYHVSQYRPIKINKISTQNRDAYDRKIPKYDDVLIYEKCMYVAENEIGLGAKLLSPPINSCSKKEEGFYKTESSAYSTTSSSTNESGANYSNCLIDVPIISSSSG
ncbi:hypothetical protein DH2020_044948 [Rehmannia glutinosa]|uniref:Uncharacterized protein n=1 Tax=Rehmannia glutinosa TaxID=99300 RepID=A0ABR0UFI6_REHGL